MLQNKILFKAVDRQLHCIFHNMLYEVPFSSLFSSMCLFPFTFPSFSGEKQQLDKFSITLSGIGRRS